jgi:hypothetical protein
MPLRSESVPTALGIVDYRLARRNAVAEYRRGRLTQSELCDAHPELRRAAEGYSRPTGDTCPICSESELVHVYYAFGPNLPSSGKCIAGRAELIRLVERSGRGGKFICYVVEVCPGCAWNHLVEAVPLEAVPRSADQGVAEAER